tara:strand:+ start:26359 stop:27078 length:720 start_codon:yes stop_codon:yes gene_type:complete
MVTSRILFYVSLAVCITFLISGYGYQWDIWSLGFAFTVLRYSAYAAIGITILNLIALWFLRKSETKAIVMIVIAFLVSALVSLTALYWQYQAGSVPPIHDITTDFENPPEFVAIVRMRENAPNPPEYEGGDVRISQEESYPEIQPLFLEEDIQDVIDRAVLIIYEKEWNLVAINRNEGRIEATEELPWFGFKDDIVLRFTDVDGRTRVDMRSKSRIGRSDIGVNAKRIDNFLKELSSTN